MLEVVEGTIEILRLAGKLKGVDVTTCAPPEVLRVRADRARLEQVLVNLLTNAADAVATAPRRSVSVKIARQDTTIALSVTDSGSGIPPDHLEKVFEPYFTTKEPGKGTGLGLPVVRQIATSLGGTATIRSRPGVGTTVDVQLPSA
jgi:C4-dicarboxylate-specific signal transduction histidine kinase